YAEEAPLIAAMHAEAERLGLKLRGRHHEIYLSDPRKSAPEKMKTVLRQPVEGIDAKIVQSRLFGAGARWPADGGSGAIHRQRPRGAANPLCRCARGDGIRIGRHLRHHGADRTCI